MSGKWKPLSALLFFVALASCAQMKTLSPADRLEADEKLEYLMLRATDPTAAREYLTLPTAHARADFIRWFWQNRPAERRVLEARTRKAREVFGRVDLLGDERVLTYIRYGPARREEYAPEPVATETSRIFVNPAEIWTYDSLGLQFDFVKTGLSYRQVGITRFGRNWFPPALEPVDYGKPPPSLRANPKNLKFAIAAYRLDQHQDTVTVELHYGIASTDPALVPAKQNLIHLKIELRGRRHNPSTTSEWLGVTPDTSTEWLVGRKVLCLPVDVYTLTATAVTIDGSAGARQTLELNLVDYIRRTQPCSDVIFYALVDSTFQSPQFERRDWRRVIPLVLPELTAGGTCYLLYEIYNLIPDTANRHRAEATYEIIDLATRQSAIVPTPTRFITGTGTTGVAVERLHTMDLKPGEYLVAARVQDLNGHRAISLTTRLRLKPNRPR